MRPLWSLSDSNGGPAHVGLYNPGDLACADSACDDAVKWYENDGDAANDRELGGAIRALFAGHIEVQAGERYVKLEAGARATSSAGAEQAGVVCMCDTYPIYQAGKEEMLFDKDLVV